MPLEEKKTTIVRTEVAGDLTFNYNQCECGSITVTVDNGINVQSIATVSNAHHPWGNVSILGSDYMLFKNSELVLLLITLNKICAEHITIFAMDSDVFEMKIVLLGGIGIA